MTQTGIPFSPKLGTNAQAFADFAACLQPETLVAARAALEAGLAGGLSSSRLRLLVAQSLLLDLVAQGWTVTTDGGTVRVIAPESGGISREAEKARVRSAHLIERDIHLKQRPVSEFVAGMERRRLTKAGWHSIFSLMRDGRDLAHGLREVASLPNESERISALKHVISPYIQVIEPGVVCPQTGIDLGDAWRYFRLTWVNAPKSVPGRSMMFLVRDAASPNHPVIGIAALGSSVVQQQIRDRWIGWDAGIFVERLAAAPSARYGRWLLRAVEGHIRSLYVRDLFSGGLVTRREIRAPCLAAIERLRSAAAIARREHQLFPGAAAHKRSAGSWKSAATSPLFRAKRCEVLAKLLGIRLAFKSAGLFTGKRQEIVDACPSPAFRAAVGQLIRITKAERVGVAMMDITVCGAIAPYTHLLGGKLVCSLLFSPEIVRAYSRRYLGHESIIASSMKGAAVCRPPRLVLLGTTSLYGKGSSQYNRLHIPLAALGVEPGLALRYEELGLSIGYGSFHVGATTVRLINTLLSRRIEGRRVNSIFGEGVNPLMRKIREALDLLDLPSDAILRHGNQRVIYGVALARNFRDVLLGLAERPAYFLPLKNPARSTAAIAEFWRNRWLLRRVPREGVLEAVSAHSLAYPVAHGARVPAGAAGDPEGQPRLFAVD